jgi:hypothetical protein
MYCVCLTEGAPIGRTAVGKKSEVSDLDETAGEHIQEEPADKFDRL